MTNIAFSFEYLNQKDKNVNLFPQPDLVSKMRHFRDRNFHNTRHSEESVLWNLIQEVCRREEDFERRLIAASQLKEFVSKVEHKQLISRNLDQVLNSLLDVFFERSGENLQKNVSVILAKIGIAMSYDAYPFFQWIFRQLQTIGNDSVRSFLVQSITRLLELEDDRKYFGKVIGIMMDELQTLLESVDNPDHLDICVDPIIIIAKNYPQIFTKHFRDTVDILVGWHIDHTQKMALTLYAADALTKLQVHWQSDLQFSLTLLSQFLEDMEAYAEDLSKMQPVKDKPTDANYDTCLSKMAALMRVFATVVRSIGSRFHASMGLPITEEFILEMLQRVIVCSQMVGDASLPVTRAADVCARLLIGSVNWHSEEMLSETLLTYAVHAVERSQSESRLLLVLEFLIVMVQEIGSALPVWFVSGLLGPSSRLLALKNSKNSLMCEKLLKLYHACLSIKSVSLLQTAFKLVAGELQCAINSLVDYQAQHHHKDLVERLCIFTDNPFDSNTAKLNTDKVFNAENMLKTVLFGISALSEVANTKNSLIGYMANLLQFIRPFSMLCCKHYIHIAKDKTPPNRTLEKVMSCATAVSAQTLDLCFDYIHRHFLNSFTSQSQPSSPSSGSLPIEKNIVTSVTTVTSNFYVRILNLISTVIMLKTTSMDSRYLLIHWSEGILYEILESAEQKTMFVNVPEYNQLIQSISILATQYDLMLAKRVGNCLKLVLKIGDSTDNAEHMWDLINTMVACSLTHLSTTDNDVRNIFLEIIFSIDIGHLLWYQSSVLSRKAHGHTIKNMDIKNTQTHQLMAPFAVRELWLVKRHHVSKSLMEELFHAHQFASIMTHLLNKNKNSSNFDLSNIYWSCQSSGQYSFSCRDLSLSTNEGYLRWWAMWECAQYTVVNKLRTPLGKAQDTFQKIEAAVRGYENQLLSSTLDNKSKVVLTKTSKNRATVQDSMNDKSWKAFERPYMLMQFMENLEKQMYNAYEGCISIATPNKAVRTFFSTNRATCMQWLNRLRLAIMKISLQCGTPQTTWYHGQLILDDMKMNNNLQGSEFERALSMSAEALIQLRCPDTLEGLYRWCRSLTTNFTKPQWGWIKAAKEQSNQNYENAVDEYKTFVNKTAKSSPQNRSGENRNSRSCMAQWKAFTAEQATECYMSLNSWEELNEWNKICNQFMEEENAPAINSSYIEALSSFESGDYAIANSKCETTLNNLSNISSVPSQSRDNLPSAMRNGNPELKSWRWPLLKQACTAHLMSVYANEENDEKNQIPDDMSKISNFVLGLNSAQWPITFDSEFLSIAFLTNAAKSGITSKTLLALNEKLINSSNDHEVILWSRIIMFLKSPMAKIQEFADKKNVLQLELFLANLHRKHGNYKTCESILNQHLISLVPESIEVGNGIGLRSIFDIVIEHENTDLKEIAAIGEQAAKLLFSTGQVQPAIEMMSKTALKLIDGDNHETECSRALLKLIKPLQLEWKNIKQNLESLISGGTNPDDDLLSNLSSLMKYETMKAQTKSIFSNSQVVAEAKQEVVIGGLLNLATMKNSTSAKAWFNMAAWSYKWGRKVLDTASTSGNFHLTQTEREQVSQVLAPHNVPQQHVDKVCEVLEQAHCNAEQTDNEILQEQNQQRWDAAEVIYEQLRIHCGHWLSSLPQQVPQLLLVIWHNVCTRLFALYEIAADAYLRFLRLNTSGETSFKYEDSNVTATLRLLRLLVKHALELQSTLKNGLATALTEPWKGIIPQLFSRLNHPEPYVRQSIADLLCRVAQDSPYLVVYPVVVETTHVDQRSRAVLDDPLQDKESSQEDQQLDEQDNVMEGSKAESSESKRETNVAYKHVLQALINDNEEMVRDVQLLVLELRRITLLWDELWIGTLNQHQQDINRRLQQLMEEAKRVNLNNSLSKEEKQRILREQQQAIMRPVVYAFKRIQKITSAEPETPHEKWFSTTMQPLVDSAMEKLINPPNPHNPNSCWSGFKQLQTQLSNRPGKLRPSSMLSLSEISPKLKVLRNTSMPIPGITSSENNISIHSCSTVIHILPTKTRPKKLQFVGTDGMRYTYLFKGLEDLHLDERIMQFLCITNCLLRRQHPNEKYAARHYSVTPFGARSGLIQWVGGAKPLFTLYKRWQQRQALIAAAKQAGANDSRRSGTTQVQVLRPSEIYNNKLTPLLKKHSVDIERTSRKEWPVKALQDVLSALIAETPSDLLQKELWCLSTGTADYWDIQQKYCRSTAVMSMIGYVIGLGDRHLDNVLIDFDSGEVVHIDYNVCFEKGLQLRVPEKVPFRLTQNLRVALGLTGIEGLFRHSCENVLSILRKGRETLLTLLEAFVYDPLVDWTGTVEGGYAGAVYGGGEQPEAAAEQNLLCKRDVEREITRSLFSSRVAEMKQGWFENRDEMLKAIEELVKQLQQFKTNFASHVETKTDIQKLLEAKSQIKLALHDAGHPFNTLKHRWMQYKELQNKKKVAMDSVMTMITKCNASVDKYKKLLTTLHSSELAELLVKISKEIALDSDPYQPAIMFLNSAGQGTLVTQIHIVEKELQDLCQKRRFALRSCLDVLTTYSAVVSQFPTSAVLRQLPEAMWSERLMLLTNSFTSANCNMILDEYKTSLSQQTAMIQTRAVGSKDHVLQQEVTNLNTQLIKLMERRNVARIDIPTLEHNTSLAHDSIVEYVQESATNAEVMMSFLSIALAALQKRGIDMETTAANAGHRLVDMTSQDGDWFLEELCSLYGNISQLMRLGNQIQSTEAVNIATGAMYCAESCFKSLLDLFNNFRNIIVPETIKLLQCEETSVLEMLNSFIGMQMDIKLDELAKQLINNLRNNSTNHQSDTFEQINHLRQQYNNLLQNLMHVKSDNARLNAGQMLLQGFDGLFQSVHSKFYDLLQARDILVKEILPHWYRLDAISQPEELLKMKFLSGNNDTLQGLLFVKQLQAMHDFFVLCQFNIKSFIVDRYPNAASGKTHFNKGLYSEERLAKPVKHYISHFVQELLVGIPSQVFGVVLCKYVSLFGIDLNFNFNDTPVVKIEDICKSYVETKYPSLLQQPRMLVYKFNRVWKNMDRMQRLDSNTVSIRASLQRSQLQLARFHWLHEDILKTTTKNVMPCRIDVLDDLNKRLQTLQRLEVMLSQTQDKAIGLMTSVQQRLKWAAGANPGLQVVLDNVKENMEARNKILKGEAAVSGKIVEMSQAAVSFEENRLKSKDADASFISLVEACQRTCNSIESVNVKITSQENLIINIIPNMKSMSSQNTGGVDEIFLRSVNDCLQQSITTARQIKNKDESSMQVVKNSLQDLVGKIKLLLSGHGKLLQDVKSLLMALAKTEESKEKNDSVLALTAYASGDNDFHAEKGQPSVKDFLDKYHKFCSVLGDILMDVLHGTDADTMLDPDPIINRLNDIYEHVGSLYGELIGFASPHMFASHSTTASQQMVNGTAPNMGKSLQTDTGKNSPRKKIRDAKTGKAIQERNFFAVSVWKRVKSKLEGRDYDANKRIQVSEQVDYVIKEATSFENLALLYEGWTAWV